MNYKLTSRFLILAMCIFPAGVQAKEGQEAPIKLKWRSANRPYVPGTLKDNIARRDAQRLRLNRSSSPRESAMKAEYAKLRARVLQLSEQIITIKSEKPAQEMAPTLEADLQSLKSELLVISPKINHLFTLVIAALVLCVVSLVFRVLRRA